MPKGLLQCGHELLFRHQISKQWRQNICPQDGSTTGFNSGS